MHVRSAYVQVDVPPVLLKIGFECLKQNRHILGELKGETVGDRIIPLLLAALADDFIEVVAEEPVRIYG